MTPIQQGLAAVREAYKLLPNHYDTNEATVLLLAIGMQESRFEHRWQVVNRAFPDRMGPARGWWQMEQGGGVLGTLRHKSSAFHATQLCRQFGIKPVSQEVYSELHRNDVLAAGFARLLLWTLPQALPEIGDVQGAWEQYLDAWRPGAYTRGTPAQRKALRDKWADGYAAAVMAL